MSAPISVVQVVRPVAGGMRAHVLALAAGLPSSEFRVIVAGPLDARTRRPLSAAGVTWANIPLPQTLSLSATYRGAQVLARLLASREAQIVHGHGFLATYAALIARRRLAAPPALVSTVHAPPRVSGGWWERMLRRRGYRAVGRQAQEIIAISEGVKESLLAVVPEAVEKTEVIPYGLRPEEFRVRVDVGLKKKELALDPSAATIGFIGRLTPDKGPDVFLRAAAEVTKTAPNVDFVLCGEGPLRSELEQQAHDLHLTGATVFLGDRRDVAEILATVDLVLLPYRETGFGVAALEAIAAGKPLIVSDIPVLRATLEGAPDVTFVRLDAVEKMAQAAIGILDRLPDVDSPMIGDVERAQGAPAAEDLLVKTEEFDLDAELEPGDQRARTGELPAGQRFVHEHYAVERMVAGVQAVYGRMIASTKTTSASRENGGPGGEAN